MEVDASEDVNGGKESDVKEGKEADVTEINLESSTSKTAPVMQQDALEASH